MRLTRWLIAAGLLLTAFALVYALPGEEPSKPGRPPADPPPPAETVDEPVGAVLTLSGSDAQPIVRRYDDIVEVIDDATYAFKRLSVELSTSSSPKAFATELDNFCSAMEKLMDRIQQLRTEHPELRNPRNRQAANEVMPSLERFQRVLNEISSTKMTRLIDKKYNEYSSDPAVRMAYMRLEKMMKDFEEKQKSWQE